MVDLDIQYVIKVWFQLGSIANENNIPIHLDGTRLVNATAATGKSPVKLCLFCTSVTFSLDKGLGAPSGSVIAGPKEFIERYCYLNCV